MSVLSETDQENVTKAAQCASLLVSDIEAITSSTNPFLAELGLNALKIASELNRHLKRLEVISKAK